jgi:hypothetical protein
MSNEAIEQRLADLTQRVAALEAKAEGDAEPKRLWQDAVGAMKDSDLFEEAMRLGAEWRARANVNGR